jgi:heat shock protein HslJ
MVAPFVQAFLGAVEHNNPTAMKTKALLTALSVLLLATACTKEELRAPAARELRSTITQNTADAGRCDASIGALLNVKWRLFELHGGAIPLPMGVERPWLELTDVHGSELLGFGGCNTLIGQFTVGCYSLAFAGLGRTHMLCPATIGLEDAFFAALASIDSYSIEGNRLHLIAGGEEVALLAYLPLAIDGPEGSPSAVERDGTPPTVPDLFD